MNARERYLSIMDFEKPDRLMKWEFGYWADTLRRWYAEGLPEQAGLSGPLSWGQPVAGPAGYWGWGPIWTPRDQDVQAYFHFDHGLVNIPVENWILPKFEKVTLSEEDNAVVFIDPNGVTTRIKKDSPATTWLAWPVKNRDDWERMKAERFQLRLRDRLPVDWEAQVEAFNKRDYPLSMGGANVSFFGSLRELLGDVNHLMAYYDQPELIHDMCDFLCNFWIELFEPVLQRVKPDVLEIFEDMAFKNGPMISPAMVREFMVPYYRRLIGFVRDHGVRHIAVDTDGDCMKLIEPFLEAGVTAMYPWEVQAGMNIVEIRKAYPKLRMLGGLDKRALAQSQEAIERELQSKIPVMLEQGGYIPYADHLIPPDVSWANYQYYRRRLVEISEQVYGTSRAG